MRPQDLRYALFDFDGVIADTEPLYLELDRVALAKLGYEATNADLRSFLGHPSERRAPELLAEHGIEATAAQFVEARGSVSCIYGSELLEPSAGLEALWEWLHERGVRVGVVSSTHVADLVLALNRWNLLRLVDVVVGRELVSATKPNPDPYLTALGYLAPELSHEEAASYALAVEDSPVGLRAAQAAGIHAIAFTGNSVEQDTSMADERCESFHELLASLAGGGRTGNGKSALLEAGSAQAGRAAAVEDASHEVSSSPSIDSARAGAAPESPCHAKQTSGPEGCAAPRENSDGISTLLAPVSGTVIALQDLPDPVFAQGILGAGCGIEPTGEVVCAPASGIISALAPSLHAFGITGDDGAEVLVHVGVDTVELGGKGFEAFAAKGSRVKAGQPVLDFDRKAITAAGLSDTVIVVVSNSAELAGVTCAAPGPIACGQLLITARR